MDNIKLITATLLEMRTSAKSITSEEDLKVTMHKYYMLFFCKSYNTFYARELYDYLKNSRDIDIFNEEFLKLIPGICNSLKMNFNAMVYLENTSKLADNQITLFKQSISKLVFYYIQSHFNSSLINSNFHIMNFSFQYFSLFDGFFFQLFHSFNPFHIIRLI